MAKKVFVSGCYDLLHSGMWSFSSRHHGMVTCMWVSDRMLLIWSIDRLKFIENHDEAIHLQIRRA